MRSSMESHVLVKLYELHPAGFWSWFEVSRPDLALMTLEGIALEAVLTDARRLLRGYDAVPLDLSLPVQNRRLRIHL